MLLEDRLAEFLTKYKNHIEYVDRSIGTKILEDALNYVRNSTLQISESEQIIKNQNIELALRGDQLNQEKIKYSNMIKYFADELNSIATFMFKKLDDKDQELLLEKIHLIDEGINKQ